TIQGIKYSDLIHANKKNQMVKLPHTDDFETALNYAYGVVDEEGDNLAINSKWTVESRSITKCKNLDKIEIIGASDVIEYDVETNVEGDVLFPDSIDSFTPSPFTYFTVKGIEKEKTINFVEGRIYTVAKHLRNVDTYRCLLLPGRPSSNPIPHLLSSLGRVVAALMGVECVLLFLRRLLQTMPT
ncbi:hypothetical protein L9F63_004618, partial [Diploptera punctata]